MSLGVLEKFVETRWGIMRLFLLIIAIIILTCAAARNAQSEPLVTISCEKPNGFNIAYGTSLTERVKPSKKSNQNQRRP